MGKPQIQSEISGYAVCRALQILFVVEMNGRGEEELIERTSYLVASFCMNSGLDPKELHILKIQRNELLIEKIKTILDSMKSISGLSSDVQISKRQKEVLSHLFRGESNKEIANLLNITERTVKFHVSSLLAKYGVSDRLRLISKIRVLPEKNFL